MRRDYGMRVSIKSIEMMLVSCLNLQPSAFPQTLPASMRLPYDRPRFIELHEQSWLPAYLRQPVQDFLSIVWLTKVPILQQSAPYEAVDDALNEIIEILDTPVEAGARDEEDDRDEGIDVLRIVDCCSGAGGPMPAIEQNLK